MLRGPAILLTFHPGSVLEDRGLILLGELRSGVGFLPMCTYVNSLSLFLSLALTFFPYSVFATFFSRACMEMVPCGCCCCPLSTLRPWTCCLHSSSREWDWAGCGEGMGACQKQGSLFLLCPRCGSRLLRFGILISRLLPQVLNSWSIGRDSLSPGQERPYR